jgi:TetR/AcrR family transcriptional repressor of nem operon
MPKSKLFDQAEVLDRIMTLFWEKGYNGTSVDDLIQASGISRSSLYDTFGDKQQLYLTVLKRYREKATALQSEMLRAVASPRKKIELIFRESIREIVGDAKNKGCFLVNATTELSNQMKPVSREACDNLQYMEDLFFDLIKEGQASGEISKKFKPRALARYLFNSLTGLRILGKTRKDKDLLDDVVRVVMQTLD